MALGGRAVALHISGKYGSRSVAVAPAPLPERIGYVASLLSTLGHHWCG